MARKKPPHISRHISDLDSELRQPLVERPEGAEGADGSGAGGAGEAAEALDAMEQGQPHQSPVSVKDLLASNPSEVIRFLQQDGLVKLGTFTVQDRQVVHLLEKGAMMAEGAQRKDVDWLAMWRAQLDARTPPVDASTWSAPVCVEASVVDVANAAHADDAGILNPLLKRFQDGGCTYKVFGLPAVAAVINYKWTAWARHFLLIELAFYLVWLLSFNAFVLIFQDEDTDMSLRELLHTREGRWAVGTEVLALVGMAPFLVQEVATAVEYGMRGWFTVWNSLDILAYAAQIAITVLHLKRVALETEFMTVLVAFQVLLLWVKLQYFARAFQPTKNAFVDTLKAVVNDSKYFLALLLLTMWGFALAFYILMRQDQAKAKDFSTLPRAVLTMFNTMLGGADMETFYNSSHPGINIALLLVFIFSMSMVLLNVLIGIMSDAWARVNNGDGSRFLAGKAQLIDELESSLPPWLLRRAGNAYPRYVHVLRVTEESVDALDALNLIEDGEDEEADPQAQLAAKVDALAVKLSELSQQLTRQQDQQQQQQQKQPGAGASNGGGAGESALSQQVAQVSQALAGLQQASAQQTAALQALASRLDSGNASAKGKKK